MFCAVKENGFFYINADYCKEDSTVKNYFYWRDDSGENIFLNAFSKKKYEEIFRDLCKDFSLI